MNIYKLIIPFGIITYSMLLLTIISGLKRWKLKYHKMLAFSTIISATIHVALVILSS